MSRARKRAKIMDLEEVKLLHEQALILRPLGKITRTARLVVPPDKDRNCVEASAGPVPSNRGADAEPPTCPIDDNASCTDLFDASILFLATSEDEGSPWVYEPWGC